MQHRHLEVVDFSAMSIDDMIERGKWQDWEKVKLLALNLSMSIFKDMIPNPSHKKTSSVGKKKAKKGIERSVTS